LGATGGVGGVGFTGNSVQLINSGTITGGNGGTGGHGPDGTGAGGAGGTGISGSNLAILNSGGTIAGGLANNGTGAQANAINFVGGSNSLTSAGASSYLGNIAISSGTLTLLQTTAAGATGTVSYNGSASSAFTGAGNIAITTDVDKQVRLSGTNTYTGQTTVNANSNLVILNSTAISANTLNLLAGSSVTLNTIALGNAVTLTGDSTFITGGSSSIAGPSGAGNLIVHGTVSASVDSLTITGASSYAGSTTIGDGTTGVTLKAGAAGAFKSDSAFTVNTNSIMDVNGASQTIGSLAGGGIVTSSVAGAVTLTAGDTTDTTFSGVIQNGAGTMSLTKQGSGALTLGGVNTYTGATTVSGGTLAILSGGSITSNVTNNATFTTAGTVTGSLTNTATVNAAGSITGAILNNGGVFTVTGALAVGSTFNNNNTAQLVVSGGNFTGITTLDNASTAAVGVSVSAGELLQVTQSTHNHTGATINNSGTFSSVTEVQNDGTFNNLAGTTILGGIQNNGTFLNAATASVDGGQNQAGTTTNNGLISGNWGVTGGTFTGTGSVIGATTIGSGATFVPGNGTAGSSMNFNGSLALQSGSIYMVQINPATSSFANVTGSATLSGGSVNANYAAGTYVAKQYTILEASTGVTGTFASLVNTNLPSGFKTALSYDANDAFLNLSLIFVPPPGSGLSGNQQNVANAVINFFNSNGSIPVVFGGLTPAGLTQISGETAVGSQQSTFNAMGMFMGLLIDPFIDGRGDGLSAGGTSATGYASTQNTGAARDAYAMFTKAPAVIPFEQRWSVWASGFGGSQTTGGNATLGSNADTSSIFGGAAGADYRFSPDTIAGLALAGGGTSFSVANGGSGRSDLFQAGAFIRHNAGAAYLTGALAYGWQDITTDRTVTVAGIDRLHAEFNANAWSGRIEGGYRFVMPVMDGVGVTPYAAGQFTTFDLPAYAEQALVGASTFALAYGAKDVTDTRSELGIRTDKSWAMPDGIFTLRGRAAWAHDYDPDRAIGATFQTLPGASFVVNGAAQAADSALVTASAEKKWLNGWSAAVTFEGEFSDVTRSYAGKGVVRYAW
jgi:autotransporter-associated beta strand protein